MTTTPTPIGVNFTQALRKYNLPIEIKIKILLSLTAKNIC